MNYIPTGPSHVSTAAAGIVVTESVDYRIPHWLEMVEQESLCKSDPYRDNHEKTTRELAQVEIAGLFD